MVKTIEEFKRNPVDVKEVREYAEEIMNFIFTRSQEFLVQNESIDTGFLLRSGKAPFWEGNTLTLEYDAPHALPVEFGQVAHYVSYQHLVGWVRRKLRISGKKGVSVAWAISKTIQEKGVTPRPYLRPAINEAIIRYKLNMQPLEISDKAGQSAEDI